MLHVRKYVRDNPRFVFERQGVLTTVSLLPLFRVNFFALLFSFAISIAWGRRDRSEQLRDASRVRFAKEFLRVADVRVARNRTHRQFAFAHEYGWKLPHVR